MKNYTPILFVSLSLLTACGGGGGASGPTVSNNVPSERTVIIGDYTPVVIETYDPVEGAITATPDDEIYTQDLNKSGAEEVVIAGRSSQSFDMETDDINTWQNYEMQVYGWNTGDFSNETESWFEGTENSILGTEPSVHFADFDGDGHVDMAVPHGTDMDLYGPSHVYFNTGSSSFERVQIDHKDTWAHDAAVADFNGDGFDDFLVGSFRGNMSLSLGAADRTFEMYQSDNSPTGVGIAVGDFLGDDTVSIITTAGGNKQELYTWNIENDELVLTRESVLPDVRFELSKWDDERAAQEDEYSTIRAITFDFDNNGIDDVVTISTLDKDDNVHGYTEVQFLQNDGSGNFTDVTDNILKDFDTNQLAPYNPVLVDVNDDGLMDILLSSIAFAEEPSTSILVQEAGGTFREQFVDEFSAYNDTLNSLGDDNLVADPVHSIVSGPDNTRYLVSVGLVTDQESGDYKNRVFLSEIGNEGTITVSNTVSALKAQWPWITDSQAQEILSLTSSGIVEGMPVIDYYKAMSPVGNLSLVSKGGKKFYTIAGHVSGVKLGNNVPVLATDSVGRTFSVNLDRSVYTAATSWDTYTSHIDQSFVDYNVRSSNLVGGKNLLLGGVSLHQENADLNNYSLSLPTVKISENAFLTASFTEVDFSPWLSMSGIWGEVNKSNITEGTLTVKEGNWIANTGIMHTQTSINPGLITSVNDIYAAWGDFGWRHKNNKFGVYGGIDPVVVSGSVNVSLPEAVDNNGNVSYSNNEISLFSVNNYYIRTHAEHSFSDGLSVIASGIVRQNNKNNLVVNVNWEF